MQKRENGFLTVDLAVALMVITIFVTIMSSVLYSLYISTTEAKRTATALNYTVDIFEYIGKVPYSIVTAKEVLSNMKFVTEVDSTSTDTEATGRIGTGPGAYEIHLAVEPQYTDNKIKLITLTMSFKISNKNTQKIEMRRLKTVEMA